MLEGIERNASMGQIEFSFSKKKEKKWGFEKHNCKDM